MATILTGEGSLTITANTAIESTASLRYVRVAFYNSHASTTRTVTVRIGTKIIKVMALLAGEDRIVGPHTVGSAETFQAWQDVGTDVNFRITGETP